MWADYEPGIHISQLQMQAGVVGINTLRTYNPAKQIADHDSDAKFIKQWLPELKDISVAKIIEHQEQPVTAYPPPIVDCISFSSKLHCLCLRMYAGVV